MELLTIQEPSRHFCESGMFMVARTANGETVAASIPEGAEFDNGVRTFVRDALIKLGRTLEFRVVGNDAFKRRTDLIVRDSGFRVKEAMVIQGRFFVWLRPQDSRIVAAAENVATPNLV